MIRVVVFTIIGVGVFIGYSFLMFAIGIKVHEATVKANGLAGLGGAKLLEGANDLFRELVEPSALEHASFVDTETTGKINKWRATYNSWREKKK